jgi:hypothetical protein
VTVDGLDNLWVVNFGQTVLGNVFAGRLSRLCGIDRAACPPGANTGAPITASTGSPDLDVDITVTPGGDGILIFVGLAPPPR